MVAGMAGGALVALLLTWLTLGGAARGAHALAGRSA
jgi:hypothetical protein